MDQFSTETRFAGAGREAASHRFARAAARLPAQAEALVCGPARHFGDFSDRGAQQGVYLFSEGEDHLYVGRTSRLHHRLINHCRGSARSNRSPLKLKVMLADAPFAVPVSRRTGWEDIVRDPAFAAAFETAKQRINRMQIRFLAEDDPLSRYLLEAYCALALEARYSEVDLG